MIAAGRARAKSAAVLVAILGVSASHGTARAGPAQAPGGCPSKGIDVATVRTADELQTALAQARPGGVVHLLPGTYRGQFVASRAGTRQHRITICGSPRAVLTAGSVDSGYSLHLDGAAFTTVIGVSVQGGLKGVVADHWNNGVLKDVSVSHVGQEAIHLRSFSSHNEIVGCRISFTGLSQRSQSTHYGEGIYVGSAFENWPNYTDGKPDRSDDNVLLDNQISHTTAESIDIKEGTSGGQAKDNHLNGVGMISPQGADSLIDVKGDGWLIAGNFAKNSPRDAFQVHVKLDRYGRDNTFVGNDASLDGSGYLVHVFGSRTDTRTACSNEIEGDDVSLTNLDTRCPGRKQLSTPEVGKNTRGSLLTPEVFVVGLVALSVLAVAVVIRRRRQISG